MRRALSIWLILLALASACAVASLSIGSVSLSPSETWHAWIDPTHPAHGLLIGLRAPRVFAGFVIGALLAISGALLQVLLRNPLAEPFVLGLSGGAALGALAALSAGASTLLITGSAGVGAFASLAILLVLAYREFAGVAPGFASERLLLCGVMLSALWGSLITLVLSLSSEDRMQAMIFWLMGDLSGALPARPASLILVALLAMACLDAPKLNLLARGEDIAASLGVAVGALKLRIVVASALAAGAAVALAGTIGFVGLVAPHCVRMAWGNDQRMLIPASALAGGSFVMLADLIGRTVAAPEQLPVGAMMAAIGAPLFLFLMWKRLR